MSGTLSSHDCDLDVSSTVNLVDTPFWKLNHLITGDLETEKMNGGQVFHAAAYKGVSCTTVQERDFWQFGWFSFLV